ncbi:hypothetical protein ABVB70_26630 [Agrobacterium radiobacter]|uniref:Uncharacterized protein n=1 Tax=Agrobacterium radiobacter TaxID=362 RepID=A0ABD5LVB2_AGRRD
MHVQQEKKAASSDTKQKEMLDRLGDLAAQNRAAYKDALDDFRDSFTLHPSINFTSED